MDRNAQAGATNLMDLEGRIVADILERFRNVMMVATERVTNKSNIGQAAYNSMRMDMETNGLIKSTEDLLDLTRQLRQLWLVGPLRRPGEGDDAAEAAMADDVDRAAELISAMRARDRQAHMGRYGSYVEAPIPAYRRDREPERPGEQAGDGGPGSSSNGDGLGLAGPAGS